MMLRERLEALTRALQPWSALWSRSVLQTWPDFLAAAPPEWMAYVRALDDAGERALDRGLLPGDPPPSLHALLLTLQALTALPWHEGAQALPISDAQGLTRKKTHEIERVLALLAPRAPAIRHAVDLGGGMGHLARLCVKTFGWTFHSIDRDAALQHKGREWLRRARTLPPDRLHFLHASIEAGPQEELDALFTGRERASLGLHTCGPLALTHLRKSREAGLLLNVGCCYDQLETPRDHPVSRFARAHALPFTPQALALATRGRPEKTEAEFALMKRVYAHRFSFELLARREFPTLGFVRAGDAPRALYAGSFAAYARNRLERLGLETRRTDSGLEDFAASTRAETRDLFLAHLLRDRFARALELVLLVDRALFLEEEGFRVELLQVFDPALSPRNVALLASRAD